NENYNGIFNNIRILILTIDLESDSLLNKLKKSLSTWFYSLNAFNFFILIISLPSRCLRIIFYSYNCFIILIIVFIFIPLLFSSYVIYTSSFIIISFFCYTLTNLFVYMNY